MANPSVTDLHCHPDLKSFLSSNDETTRIKCWPNLSVPNILQIIDTILLGNILASQNSLNQLNSSSGNIALVGLYAFEKAMVKGDLFNILGVHVNIIRVARILELMGYHHVIDYELMKRISSPRSQYFKLFKEVQNHLLESRLINPKYKLLNKIDEYDPNSLNLIFTIEGGHNLFRKTFGCNLKRDVLENFRELKRGTCRYLHLSLAHIERNRLCNHAYGIKILHHRRFKPVGCGITGLGREVITEALKKSGRILIDLKHMSLEARKQYYDVLNNEYGSEKIPILVSHGGVTGVSYENMPVVKCKCCCRWTKVQYYQPDGLMGTHFNPWSINLYDEEIKKIVDSDGLIGLNLDKRILGARQKKRSELIEYFSRKERNSIRFREHHVPISHIQPQGVVLSSVEMLNNKIEEKLKEYLRKIIRRPDQLLAYQNLYNEIEQLYNQLRSMPVPSTDEDIKHLCNNILHIVRIAGDKAWKHICIGSDFDGLISAVECCRNASVFNNLASELKRWLPIMAASDPGLSSITNIDQKVDDIMSVNLYDFLKKNFI